MPTIHFSTRAPSDQEMRGWLPQGIDFAIGDVANPSTFDLEFETQGSPQADALVVATATDSCAGTPWAVTGYTP